MGRKKGVLAGLAVLCGCLVAVAAWHSGAASARRGCVSDPAAAPAVSLPATITGSGCETDVYKLTLKFGDIIHLRTQADGGISGNLFIPADGQLLGRQTCSDDYNTWTVSKETPLDCTIPKTGDYYLDLENASHSAPLSITVSRPQPHTYTVQPSCSMSSAPLIKMNTTQFGAGLACPSGRTYAKMKLTQGQTVVFQWTEMTQLGNVPDFAKNSGVYPPGTNEFTIDKKQTCGQSTYYGTGGQIPLEICPVRKTGVYLVAYGYFPMQFFARVKH